jgi:hypothetical protein
MTTIDDKRERFRHGGPLAGRHQARRGHPGEEASEGGELAIHVGEIVGAALQTRQNGVNDTRRAPPPLSALGALATARRGYAPCPPPNWGKSFEITIRSHAPLAL